MLRHSATPTWKEKKESFFGNYNRKISHYYCPFRILEFCWQCPTVRKDMKCSRETKILHELFHGTTRISLWLSNFCIVQYHELNREVSHFPRYISHFVSITMHLSFSTISTLKVTVTRTIMYQLPHQDSTFTFTST